MDKEEEIIKGNILISKYLKLVGGGGLYIHPIYQSELIFKDDLLYHEDWNWIMVTLDQCNINGIFTSKYGKNLEAALLNLDIEGVWNVIINFIKGSRGK